MHTQSVSAPHTTGANLYAVNADGHTPMDEACSRNNLTSVASSLQPVFEEFGFSARMQAAAKACVVFHPPQLPRPRGGILPHADFMSGRFRPAGKRWKDTLTGEATGPLRALRRLCPEHARRHGHGDDSL